MEGSKRETLWTAEVRVEGYHNEWSSTEEEGREGARVCAPAKKAEGLTRQYCSKGIESED